MIRLVRVHGYQQSHHIACASHPTAMAIHGDTLVVGAPASPLGDIKDVGAVYMFQLRNSRWQQQARLVSNEVGLGIVPDNRMARDVRDHAGRLHQDVAAIADTVYFVAAGLPLKMKG